VVSIHAIATFQALHDYLRPRVAGLLSSSRLSGMFAALAASGFVGSTSKPDDPSKAKPTDSGAESSVVAAPASTIQRRRSQRLSAKQAGSSSGEPVAGTNADSSLLMDMSLSSTSATVAASNASTLEAVLAPVEPGTSDNIVDSGLQADFTDDEDDEVDAEVFDDEVDPDTSLSEKTVTVSVVEGLVNQYPI
jgi:E3 ubiquitin-protein ligase TRIP12